MLIMLNELTEKVAQIRREEEEAAKHEEMLALSEQIDVANGCVIEAVDEAVICLPAQINEQINLEEDIAPPKEMVSVVPVERKVGLHDLGQIILKRLHKDYMPMLIKHLWRRHVNYRAFIGNSVGKCALRPP